VVSSTDGCEHVKSESYYGSTKLHDGSATAISRTARPIVRVDGAGLARPVTTDVATARNTAAKVLCCPIEPAKLSAAT